MASLINSSLLSGRGKQKTRELLINFVLKIVIRHSLLPSPGDLPDPGIELLSPVSPALAGGFFTPEPPEKP